MGRYAQELAEALIALGGGPGYTLFYNRADQAWPEAPLDRLPRLAMAAGDRPWRLRVLLAHLTHRPQDRLFPGVAVFHGMDHLLPRLRRVRGVFTLHDLTVRIFPGAHTLLNRWYLTLMMPRFLAAADAIVADSEATRRDALRLYRLDEGRVQVVHAGVSPRFRPGGLEAVAGVRRRYGLPEGMILYVGTIEPRKNLVALLEAYRALRDRGRNERLVIAGRQGWHAAPFLRRLRQLGLQHEVILPGHIDDRDLPALYSAAKVFVFPSLYEGFGLPVLEAMACGTPVICSDASSLPEVAGEAALLVPPRDVGGLAEAMGAVLSDGALRAELARRGLARARLFTWEKAAHAMQAVYRALGAS